MEKTKIEVLDELCPYCDKQLKMLYVKDVERWSPIAVFCGCGYFMLLFLPPVPHPFLSDEIEEEPYDI